MLYAQLAAAGLAVFALAAVGCGSSETHSTTTAANNPATATTPATTAAAQLPAATTAKIATGKPLTRARLIATADSICAAVNTKLASMSAANEHDYARVFPQAASYDTTESGELSKLVPPGSMRSLWAKMLGDFQAYGQYVSQVARYAQANNLKAAAPLLESANALRQTLNLLAVQNGFKDCSKQG